MVSNTLKAWHTIYPSLHPARSFLFQGKFSPKLQNMHLPCYLCAVPDDQLLQNLPRAEMQQGYVVVAVCSAHFSPIYYAIFC